MSRVQQNEVVGRLAVSDADSRRYYEAHAKDFTTPQSITLREIMVMVPGDGKTLNVGLDEEARNKANAIRQRALAGESFEKLAADLSEAPSRANAGLIGPLNLSELSPELQSLVGAMKAGDISQVLRSQKGYQILKLEATSVAATLPFEQAHDQISERVFAEKRKAEFDKYLRKLRAEAIVEFKNPDIKKAYDAGLERLKAAASQ
jgi:parvulin-like peptidyl-prolyl isomerase